MKLLSFNVVKVLTSKRMKKEEDLCLIIKDVYLVNANDTFC